MIYAYDFIAKNIQIFNCNLEKIKKKYINDYFFIYCIYKYRQLFNINKFDLLIISELFENLNLNNLNIAEILNLPIHIDYDNIKIVFDYNNDGSFSYLSVNKLIEFMDNIKLKNLEYIDNVIYDNKNLESIEFVYEYFNVAYNLYKSIDIKKMVCHEVIGCILDILGNDYYDIKSDDGDVYIDIPFDKSNFFNNVLHSNGDYFMIAIDHNDNNFFGLKANLDKDTLKIVKILYNVMKNYEICYNQDSSSS